MPLQNRVTPRGEIIATAARGTLMGNRGGRLHNADKTLTWRRWSSYAWITCRLSFKGRQRVLMSPRSYTELFFLDEATALAAGHRPCAECRRQDFNSFMTLWAASEGKTGRAYVDEVDPVLQAERVAPDRTKRTYRAPLGGLPDGSFIEMDGEAWLVGGDRLYAWSPAGYTEARHRPSVSDVKVLTPRHIVTVLEGGYRPSIHSSALGLESKDRPNKGRSS